MVKSIFKFYAGFMICLSLSGCVKMALKLTPSFVPRLSQAFFEECDPNLAKDSLPGSLKLMEGLLKNDPKNEQLLTTLCAGFAGYAMLFVEDEDPERASALYLRARNYGFRALGQEAPHSGNSRLGDETIRKLLKNTGERHIEALFWTTMSWNAWINLNLDKPAALGELGSAQTFLNRILEIKPGYFYGAPYILMGSILSSMPGPLGGDASTAKEYFEKAIQESDGRFFLAHYYLARYYAVRVQDKDLFFEFIEKVERASPEELKEACLINAVMKQKSKRLKEMSEELFL